MTEREGRDAARKIIEDILRDYDNLELLSRLCLYSYFGPRKGKNPNWELREIPLVEFLGGLCLSKSQSQGNEEPTVDVMSNLVNALQSYFDNDVRMLMGKPLDENIFGKDHVIFMTRLQKILGQVNAGGYETQLVSLTRDIFSKMNDYFLRTFGFTIPDALEYQQKLKARLERRYKMKLTEARNRLAELEGQLKDPIIGVEIRKGVTKKGISEEQLLQSIGYQTAFGNSKELLTLSADSFCSEEGINDKERFRKYLATFSCKLGNQGEINSVLDDNIAFIKPFISLDENNYLTPFLFIFANPYPLFRSLLEGEKRKNTKDWIRFKDIRSKYIEKLVLEYISRIFPKDSIKPNLYFNYENKRREIDCLVQYDDKIFLIESKSGAFTEPAKRGGLESLKDDLNELVAKAYEQAQNAAAYIRSQEYAEFEDEKGNVIYKIPVRRDELTFFLLNVTLEPLWSLSIEIKTLETLGLFKNDYPWSVNIFDLDQITKIITLPSIFVHYTQKRLETQRSNVYLTPDEMSLLQLYLFAGDIPSQSEGQKAIKITLAGFTHDFDNHFIFGMKAPRLNIEPEWQELVEAIETIRPHRYSRIASALLDLDHESRKIIINKLKRNARKAIKDRNPHSFVSLVPNSDIGFSFVCVYKDNILDYLLYSGSEEWMKKYNKKIWIGIGKDVAQKEKFATSFYYSESEKSPLK